MKIFLIRHCDVKLKIQKHIAIAKGYNEYANLNTFVPISNRTERHYIELAARETLKPVKCRECSDDGDDSKKEGK